MKVEIKDKKGKDISSEFLIIAVSEMAKDILRMRNILIWHDILFALLTILTILNFTSK